MKKSSDLIFESRELSNEQKARIAIFKQFACALYDQIDSIPKSWENARYIALAKTELESAVQWAVKAHSRG